MIYDIDSFNAELKNLNISNETDFIKYLGGAGNSNVDRWRQFFASLGYGTHLVQAAMDYWRVKSSSDNNNVVNNFKDAFTNRNYHSDKIGNYFVRNVKNVDRRKVLSHIGDTSRDPQPGRMYNFDLTNYVNYGRITSLEIDDFVGMVYFQFTTYATNVKIFQISYQDPGGIGINYETTSNRVRFYCRIGASWEFAEVTGLSTGTMYKAIFYKNGTEMYLNINGTTDTNTAGGTSITFQSTGRTTLGANWTGATYNHYLDGYAFAPVFYAYNETVKDALIAGSLPHEISTLPLFYDKTDNTSLTTSYDSSGNGNDGTKVSFSAGNHYTGSDVPYSSQNQLGYTFTTDYIPRDESDITKDVSGADLEYRSKVSFYGHLAGAKVISGDGTNVRGEITTITTTINSTDYYKVKLTAQIGTPVAIQYLFDNTTSGTGISASVNTSGEIVLRIDESGGDYIADNFTPNGNLSEYEFWFKSDDIKCYENGVELSGTPSSSGDIADFTNTNKWFIFCKSDSSAFYDDTISDLDVNGKWYPMQEEAGSTCYNVYDETGTDVITLFNAVAGDWTSVTNCSFYNETYGFYDNSGTYIPAYFYNLLKSVLGNSIEQYRRYAGTADIDFTADIDAPETKDMPTSWSNGDSVPDGKFFLRREGSYEENIEGFEADLTEARVQQMADDVVINQWDATVYPGVT